METAVELMLRLSVIKAELERIASDVTVASEVARAAGLAARALEGARPMAAEVVARNRGAN
jgi:hypothetical protein